MRVLITGGAGFIGLQLTRRLLREGCEVSILDNFNPQIHGENRDLPPEVAPHVRLYRADVRDRDAFNHALKGHNTLVHLAAETGTGQSMYQVSEYEQVNIAGTANLIDVLVNDPHRTIEKIVVASSRAVYGEGKYRCTHDGEVFPRGRKREDLHLHQFEPRCPICDQPCEAVPTSEASPFLPTSFYGLTKQVQEQMVLMFASVLGISAFALRYQNVYGPGQSLHNPYTGILAIFASQARIDQTIHIFEDGHESRDFVYVDDVVEGTWRCMSMEGSWVEAVNIGSGCRTTVLEVAHEIVADLGSKSNVGVDGTFREGDIRHNCADIAKARSMFGFEPQWQFRDGLHAFLRWAESQRIPNSNKYELSLAEVRERGILRA